MSKDRTPEVGDVWKNDKGKVFSVIEIGEHLVGIIYKSFFQDAMPKDAFVNFSYLGKSKANIDDLFKTENEE